MNTTPPISSAGPTWLAAGLGGALGILFEHRRRWQDRFVSRGRRTARFSVSLAIATAVLALVAREATLPSLLVMGTAVAVLQIFSSLGARMFSFALAVWLLTAAAPDWTGGFPAMASLRPATMPAETDLGMIVGAVAAASIAAFLTFWRRIK